MTTDKKRKISIEFLELQGNGNLKKILIVDDEVSQRRILRKMFEEANVYKLYEAEDGLDALNLILKDEVIPDLIVLDLKMPHLDGLEFLHVLRGKPEYKGLPIIICSVVEDRETVQQVMAYEVRDFITKPVDKVALSVRVGRIFRD